MNNPYSWNTINPEIFYGRQDILSNLLSGLPGSPRFSFGISGGRRMGKTTLLRKVEKDLLASIEQWRSGGLNVVPIYIDGLALPNPLSSSMLWSILFNEIRYGLKINNLLTPEYMDFSVFREIFKPLLVSQVMTPRIILLFDEIELILAYDWAEGWLDNMRAALANSPGLSEYLTAVFAGAHEMKYLQTDFGSPLKDILEWRRLAVLEYADACDLMQKPIDKQWPKQFLDKVYSETGGHPMLIQYVMQYICSHVPDPQNEIDLLSALSTATDKFQKERSWQFREWWTRYATPTGQRVYSRLPDDGSPIDRLQITREFGIDEGSEALEMLQHVGLAVSVEEDLSYRYCGEMFRRWYKRYGILDDTPQHDPEIYSRLHKNYPKAAGKYLSAWRIYQNELPNYSGVLAEIRGVIECMVDQDAPVEELARLPDFRLENGQIQPTLRQRLKYMARKTINNSDLAKELVHDYNLLEVTMDQMTDRLARLATVAMRSSSGMVHDIATRDMAFRALKQWDGILAQLLPE